MPKEEITLDYDWISLPKGEFRLLVMIADVGSNLGCASDICRYFRPQTKNPASATRNIVVNNLELLVQKGFITLTKSGRRYTATLIKPIAKEIAIERQYLTKIIHRQYSRSVAWENVLKVYIWLLDNGNNEFTNRKIEEMINVSESTITEAKNVLQDFGAVIIKHLIIRPAENVYMCYGQSAELSAFWYITWKQLFFAWYIYLCIVGKK